MTTALAVTLAPLGALPLTGSLAETAAQPTERAAAAVSTAAPGGRTDRFPPYPTQPVEPRTVIDGRILPGDHEKIRVDTPNGQHVWTASTLLGHDLPAAAMRAYKAAARKQDALDPSCHLSWTLLAGIGRVESNHGRFGGSVLGSDGYARPTILGVELNGAGPVAAIRDTDHGRWDGDTVWDRAVGPMQFIPSTWAASGRDGDGDGVASPNDINDAALAAAAYLCSGPGSSATGPGMRAAVFRYNPSTYYVSLVTAFARGYQTGAFVIPSPPVPIAHVEGAGKSGKANLGKAGKKAAGRKAGAAGSTAGSTGGGRPKPGDGPTSKPTGGKTTAGGAPSPTGPSSGGPSSGGSSSGGSSSGGTSSGGGSSSPSPTPSPTPSPSSPSSPGSPGSARSQGSPSSGSSGSPSSSSPASSGSPSSSSPASSGSPSSSSPASPSPPALTTVKGVLAGGPGSWTVGGRPVDFGTPSGATLGKLDNLVGQSVIVQVDDLGVAQTLNGEPL